MKTGHCYERIRKFQNFGMFLTNGFDKIRTQHPHIYRWSLFWGWSKFLRRALPIRRSRFSLRPSLLLVGDSPNHIQTYTFRTVLTRKWRAVWWYSAHLMRIILDAISRQITGFFELPAMAGVSIHTLRISIHSI